ncbi:virB8 family protein [Steroidobacter agaridevorans]|uniref:virB8 family protein n=1 Tax=Steroidobacter agaridevorans TaxID=2695856 RepID=UPI00137A62DF|nr:type IV secretion system protein [Steroidobacter agaridevorans]
MSKDAALEAYFAEAASWDADRAAQAQRTLRIAWSVAGAGWVCAIVVAVALMLLTPLKRVEPFVIRVDNTSGLVDVVPVFVGQADMPETVTRYFLDHYVSVCERFTHATAESDYEECGAFHTPQRNQAWYAQWNRSNPTSPLNIYKDGTTVRAQVTSISFFTRASATADLAQVRYIRATRSADGAEEQRSHWIATIQYAYGEPSKDAKVRRWNPLGFRIIDFRPEPEVITESASAPTTLSTTTRASRGATP